MGDGLGVGEGEGVGFEELEADMGDVGDGDLEAVEQESAAALGDVVAGDGAEDVGESDLDGGGVLEQGEVEGIESLGAEVVIGETGAPRR